MDRAEVVELPDLTAVTSPAVRLILIARLLEAWHSVDHPRDARGRFRAKLQGEVTGAVARALSGGASDALEEFDRQQLRREARRRGIQLPRGASIDAIKDALFDSESDRQNAPDVAVPPPEPEVPPLSGKAAGNPDAQRMRSMSREEAAREFDRLPPGARNTLLRDLGVKTAGVTNEGKKKRALTAIFDAPHEEARPARPSKAERLQSEREEAQRRIANERETLLEEVAALAAAQGHDGQAKRAAADEKFKTNADIRKFIADVKAFQQRQAQAKRQERQRAEDARASAAARAARDAGPATKRQVDYIMDLLAKRRKSGEGGGFMVGPTTRAEVAKMTFADASAYINSLTGNY